MLYTLVFTLISLTGIHTSPDPHSFNVVYQIIVSEPDGEDASVTYQIEEKNVDTGEDRTLHIPDLDSFVSYLIKDARGLDDDKNNFLFYIHGMWGGNSFVFNRTVRLMHEAYIKPDSSDIARIIAVKWPGNDMEYKDNKANVFRISDELAKVMAVLVRSVQLYDFLHFDFDTEFDLLAHSLGNELFKEIYLDLPEGERIYPMFDQVILAAPDLDSGLFSPGGALDKLHFLAEGINVYFSRKDMTLSVSERLNDRDRLGIIGPRDEHDVARNIRFIDVSEVSDEHNLRERLMGHSYFRGSDTAREHILGVLMAKAWQEVHDQDTTPRIYTIQSED